MKRLVVAIEAKREKIFKKVLSDIEWHNVSIIMVADYAYTIGMAKHGMPDLVVSTRDVRLSRWLLNMVATELLQGEAQSGALSRLIEDADGESLDLYLEPLPVDRRGWPSIGLGLAFYDFHPEVANGAVSLTQVYWPDAGGHFPTSREYDADRYHQEVFHPDRGPYVS